MNEMKLARAEHKYARISPRKVEIVCNMIRGKDAKLALALMENTPKAGCELMIKVLKSAMANAENNFEMDPEKLYVAQILADSIYEIGSEEAKHILATKKDPKYGLYIKVDGQNTAQFRQCCAVLARYKGMMPVYFYLQDTKQYVKAPPRLWMRESINALDELKYVVGESNVVIRK